MELKITEIENIPENNTLNIKKTKSKPKISYEDILANMGMFVSNGQLHLIERDDYLKYQEQTLNQNLNPKQKQNLNSKQKQNLNPSPNPNQYQVQNQNYVPQDINQNTYIYNKYFKDTMKPEPVVRRPKTLQEYKMMLIQDYIEKQKMKQIRSTKLILPTTDIGCSQQGLPNKMFNYKYF